MSMELVYPYVAIASNPSVDGYLNWAKNNKDELYKLKYEQVGLRLYFKKCVLS